MRLHRFYAHKNIADLGQKSVGTTLTWQDLGGQWSRVFRFRKGDSVILFDGDGMDYVSEIVNREKIGSDETFSLCIRDVKQGAPKPRAEVTLYASIIKKANFELVAQKAVEIGVSTISPTVSDRTEKKDINHARLQTIVIEAVEQSGRGDIPSVTQIVTIDEAVEKALAENEKVFYYDKEGTRQVGGQESKSDRPRIAIFVGPEGGWSDREKELFSKKGIQALSLGDYTLRAETAVIVAISRWI